MTVSYTGTEAVTFTVTHARHLAAKVATDLKRIQRLYGSPSDGDITDYEAEMTELLRGGYLATVAYGFKRDGKWIEPTLRYTARELVGAIGTDDDPGRIQPNADIARAAFSSFLTYSDAWRRLTDTERDRIRKTLPFQRTTSAEPSVNGRLEIDRSYSAGGRALHRESVRSY